MHHTCACITPVHASHLCLSSHGRRGIADTKFEFGLDDNGTVVLMDEILTPDSSRFWPADEYKVGQSEPSFDKQFIRDWLESQPWNKKAPAPKIPQDVLDKTSSKYEEALIRLTGKGVTA